MSTDTHPKPLHVLVAGGGVAALETMMALRALARDQPNVRSHLEGREVLKAVVVPGRLVNLVVR